MSEDFGQKTELTKNVEAADDSREPLERSNKAKNNFAIISRDLYQKSGLSLEALGLISYLMSLPNDWIVYVSQLKKVFKVGKNKILSILKELSTAGYMHRYPVRDLKGRISGWKTKYSDIPEFLCGCPELRFPALDNPELEKPELGKLPLQNNNNTNKLKLLKNNHNVGLVASETDNTVVVSLKEKIKGLLVSDEVLGEWLKKYGFDYVNEKVELTLSNSNSNPEGFLNKAISNDWKPSQKKLITKKQDQTFEPQYPSHNENIIWFKSLSDQDKLKYQQITLQKYNIFSEHLKHQKVSILDSDFVYHNLFTVMMNIIGRAK